MLSRGAVLLDACIVLATVAQVAVLSRIVEPFLLRSTDIAAVIPTAALLLTVTAIRALVLGAREAIGLRAAARAKSSLRRATLCRLVQLRPPFVHGERTGELVTLLGAGLERMDVWISRYLPQRILPITRTSSAGVCVSMLRRPDPSASREEWQLVRAKLPDPFAVRCRVPARRVIVTAVHTTLERREKPILSVL